MQKAKIDRNAVLLRFCYFCTVIVDVFTTTCIVSSRYMRFTEKQVGDCRLELVWQIDPIPSHCRIHVDLHIRTDLLGG